MPEIFFKTAEIFSQFPAREKISWELGSQVPEENPALVLTVSYAQILIVGFVKLFRGVRSPTF